MACWVWVVVPILGVFPGSVPVRLSTQWLSVLASLTVVGLGVASGAGWNRQRPFGWLILAAVGLAWCHADVPDVAFLWACQATLVLSAGGCLARCAESRWLREAVVACAWAQVLVCGLQVCRVPLPWPQQPHGAFWGTMGSRTTAALVTGIGCLWSSGWPAWGLGVATGLMGSATMLPVVVVKLAGTNRRVWDIVGLLGVIAVAWGPWPPLIQRLSLRCELWRAWRGSWWGNGFHPFPSGFQDETAFGHAMRWRDYHNVYLDWLARFGILGAVVLAVAGWWLWRARRAVPSWLIGSVPAFLWIAWWQSLEQFPVGIVLVIVWWCGVCQSHPPEEV